jgi:hypothetical protein
MAGLLLFHVAADPCYHSRDSLSKQKQGDIRKEGRMDAASDNLSVYRELADHYDRLGQVSMRDRFLMLAADAALEAGQPAEAERFRQRLLATSRHHMLRPYASFAEAVHAPDVEAYLHDLRANYPLDDARELLDTLRTGEPASPPSIRPIPPTAPLLDLDSPRGPRRDEEPRPTYGLRDEDPAPAQRPRAQPLPGRRSAPAPEAAPPVARPLAPIPLAPSAPAAKPAEGKGAWLCVALLAVAAATAVALAAFTLARPFLPETWLP